MIELERVTKRHGAMVAVDDVSLAIPTGEFCVVIGSSGAGKSTMLRMINRLTLPSTGTIRIDGASAERFKPEELRRRMGYVIQSIGLFPHWTVGRNIGAVPELLGWSRNAIHERAAELLSLLQLDPGRFLDRYPHQLSIGQQQRVGIARALAADPEILLMDEPFGALDPITREALQHEIAEVHRRSRKTIVFVTHDMDEALRLGSRIVIMDRGRLVQAASPVELLTTPANDFVREFIGGDDRGVKLLAVQTVADCLRSGEAAPGTPIAVTASLRQALARMVAERVDRLAVVDAGGRALGAIQLTDLVRR